MAFFKRMKEIAEATSNGTFVAPSSNDKEGQTALSGLEFVWEEVWGDLNIERPQGAPELSIEDVKTTQYLDHVLQYISHDEALAFDDWHLGQGRVSFVKDFPSHEDMARAYGILSTVDTAQDHMTERLPAIGHEEAFSGVRESSRDDWADKIARKPDAKRLAVRRDWMEAFAEKEDKVGCLPAR